MLTRLNTTYISEQLAGKLFQIADYPVTSIVAPIGYGKTRAVSWWAEQCREQDPEARILRQVIVTDSLMDFWRGFCRNLREWPALKKAMESLGFPTEPQARQLMLELLDDALRDSGREFFYIIDDLHFLPNPSFTELILFLSGRLPERTHIILLSRNVIFDRAAQMRLGPRLWELRVDDLRLSRDGVREYARRGGRPLKGADVEMLERSTEGWFSMVYLKLRAYVQTGSWPENTSSIYPLIDEVLFRPLPERQRAFLVCLGVPDAFTAEEAAFLWREGDAGALLNGLTEQNAFITCTDGIYRYHNMLRSCAREKFAQLPEEKRRACLMRLGQWYEKTGEYYEAALCYERCHAWPELLRAFFADQARSITGENKERMLSWYTACPEAVWKQYPNAMLVMLRKLFSFGCIGEMQHMHDLLSEALAERDDLSRTEKDNYLGEAELYMSFLAFNDISAMSAYHRHASALMTRPVVGLSGGNWTFGSPSVLLLYHRTRGGLDHENAEMRECMPYFYQVTDGHGSGAEHVMQAETDFYRGNLLDAELSCRKAVSAARRKGQFSLWTAADCLRAQMLLCQGDWGSAEEVLRRQEELLRRERRYDLLYTLELCRAWLLSLLGRRADTAPLWLQDEHATVPMMRPAAAMVELTRSQMLLARREWAAVAAREETVHAVCRSYRGMLLCGIWAEVQLCAAYERLGRREEALRHLETALDDALPDGLVLPFVLECTYLTDCLCALLTRPARRAAAEKLLQCAEPYRDARAAMLRECFPTRPMGGFGLTERELEIAQMTAQRRTRREIGDALGISEKTVSNRLTTIYEKLGLDGQTLHKRQALIRILEQSGVQ